MIHDEAEEFRAVRNKQILIDMKEKLSDKFASEKHAGPKDVSDFMDLADEEEIELIRRDAYEQVSALIEKI